MRRSEAGRKELFISHDFWYAEVFHWAVQIICFHFISHFMAIVIAVADVRDHKQLAKGVRYETVNTLSN